MLLHPPPPRSAAVALRMPQPRHLNERVWSTFTRDLTWGWRGETQWVCELDAMRLDRKSKPIGREKQRQGEAQTKRRQTDKELKGRQAETETTRGKQGDTQKEKCIFTTATQFERDRQTQKQTQRDTKARKAGRDGEKRQTLTREGTKDPGSGVGGDRDRERGRGRGRGEEEAHVE